MIKSIKGKTMLYKLFVSYLVIFVAPLIVMTGFLYKTAVVDLEREIESSNVHKLNQLKDTVNLRLKELKYIALNIQRDYKLSPTAMNSGEYRRTEGINQINMYKMNSAFLDDLFIYYKSFDRAFSASGLYSLSTLMRYVYVLNPDSQESFMNQIYTLNTPKLRPAEKIILFNSANEMLTYLYPLYFNSGESGAVVMFAVSKSSFDKMFDDILGDMPGGVFILDKEGNLLLSTIKGAGYSQEDIIKMASLRDSGIDFITIGGRRQSVISILCEETGWKYVTAVQTTQLFEKVDYMRSLIFEIALAVLAFGIFLIFIMSSKNYKPIKEILGFIRVQWSGGEASEEMDEMGQIERTVVSAINQNKDLKAQIDMQRPLIAGQIMTKLLNGEVKDRNQVENLVRISQISLGGPFYTVMVVSNGNEKDTSHEYLYNDNVMFAIRNRFAEKNIIYPVELVHNNAIALVANLAGEDLKKEYRLEIAGEVRKIVEEQAGQKIVIGIGKTYSEIMQLNRSFIEAMAAMEGSVRGGSKIVFFDDIMEQQKQIYWYPAEDQLRFVESLKQGDRQVALETLNNMMGNIAEKETSILMVKYVCFDIVNMIIKTVNEMNMREFNDDIGKLMEFTTLEDLERSLELLTGKFCDFVQEKKNKKDDELYNRIITYVNENYTDVNLSLDNISCSFKLPIYFLSRFFKEQTGSTFTDYITKLRMDKAKELLVETDSPIKEIVCSLGYSDLPSFIRRFKKIHGITPGQYRDTYSKK